MSDALTIKTGTFYFDPQDRIYESHFPGYAVVPGSVIIGAFIKALKVTAPYPGQDYTISNFRFRRFVTPGKYSYHLQPKKNESGAKTIQCRLTQNDLTFVSGKVLLCK